jgi:hypothetical protein
LQRKSLPVQIRAQTRYRIWALLFTAAYFYQRRTPALNILYSKIRHENDYIFKNVSSKKGVQILLAFQSNNNNKSIANFRETIPLSLSGSNLNCWDKT